MEAAYFSAAIPEPFRIFGVELLPLSLGRYRFLKRFDSPFVSEVPRNADFGDLLVAVIICSMRTAELLDFIQDACFSQELQRFGERIRAEIKADPTFNMFAKFGLMKRYIELSSQVPEYTDEQPDDRKSPMHWSQTMEAVLRSELGYTSAEIEEGPLGKAILDYFVWAQSQGRIRLVSEDDKKHGQTNAEMMAMLLGKDLCRD